MRRFTREDWDGRKTLVVRRAFKGAGRTFAPGDAFEWKRYGVEPRRVRQLYEAGFLDHEDAPVFTAQPGAARWSVAPRVEEASEPVTEPEPEQVAEQVTEQVPDDLDGLNRNELWEVAEREGAPKKLRADEQREAIRAHRVAASEASTEPGTL
jgi:hypothetical protein